MQKLTVIHEGVVLKLYFIADDISSCESDEVGTQERIMKQRIMKQRISVVESNHGFCVIPSMSLARLCVSQGCSIREPLKPNNLSLEFPAILKATESQVRSLTCISPLDQAPLGIIEASREDAERKETDGEHSTGQRQ